MPHMSHARQLGWFLTLGLITSALAVASPLMEGPSLLASPNRRLRPRRVILYARVSRDRRRHGRQRSVDEQLALGRKRAREFGYEIVAEYFDNDASASEYSSGERPDWEKVERDIEAGKADVLWLWEISRGTRDLVVWAHFARACKEKQMWVTLDDEEYDITKPRKEKQLNDLAVDAAYEAGKVHDRVGRDVEANAERGGVHGPWGYGFRHQFDPHTGEFLCRVVHEPEAHHVRVMAVRFLRGWGLKTIAADLNRRKVPTSTGLVAGERVLDEDGQPVLDDRGDPVIATGWSYQVIKQLLLRASMIGKRSWKGKIILDEGGHEAIFDGGRYFDDAVDEKGELKDKEGMVLSEAAWWKVRKKLLVRAPSAEVSALTSSARGRVVRPRDGGATRLVSGLGRCGVCTALVYPNPKYSGQYSWEYRCIGLYDGAPKACVARSGELLDRAVETLVVARFSRPDAMEAFRVRGQSSAEVAAAEARKAALEVEMDELVAEVRSGKVSRRLAAADEERIEAELAVVKEVLRPELVEPLAEELVASDPVVVQRTWRAWTVEQQRHALRVFAPEIVVPRLGPGRRNVPPSEYVHITWAERKAS
ncbi:recombinase family protein [Nocardiopsis terrae]|uniref:recombinase family protein n=1 Tax=Streptomyces sp. NPDC057554 TaxID=3350538 RepID=UPI0036AE7ACA